MRLVIQRVSEASVEVDGEIKGKIGSGLLVLVGFSHEDNQEKMDVLIHKLIHLRIFDDGAGKMNLSLLDVGGSILSVSQFTLYGECRKGRRPHFTKAAKPDLAGNLYHLFNERLRQQGVQVETGEFGANMKVALVNDGPVTISLDSVDFIPKDRN